MRVAIPAASMCPFTAAMGTSRLWKMPAASAAAARVWLKTCKQGRGGEEGGKERAACLTCLRQSSPWSATENSAATFTHLSEVARLPCPAAGDDWDGHRIGHSPHQLKIEALQQTEGEARARSQHTLELGIHTRACASLCLHA
jgi:hypothetical protein